jgi:WD40 repeat protein
VEKRILLAHLKYFKSKKSNAFCIKLLNEFVKSEKIQARKYDEHVFFTEYLYYIQQTLIDDYRYSSTAITVSEIFTKPFLTEQHGDEGDFIGNFLSEEKIIPIMSLRDNIKYKFTNTKKISFPASALAMMPDGNFLSATCLFDDTGHIYGGSIVLHDASGQVIKVLVNEAASGLAILPDGNILSSTCTFDRDGNLRGGSIVLRDSSGIYIKTLIEEPATALAILPDGNFLSTTCLFDHDGSICTGTITLRDPSGKCIKILADEPTSALAVMPNGNILSSVLSFDEDGYILKYSYENEIVIRDFSGNHIETLAHQSASALAVTSNGKILSSVFSFDEQRNFIKKEISFNTVQLIKEKKLQVSLIDRINEALINNAVHACLQFQQGSKDRTNLISILPSEVLHIIYSYVFPFPDMSRKKIINPDCFFYPKENDIETLSSANLFSNAIIKLRFFDQKVKKQEELIIAPKEENILKDTGLFM